ncbi:MAG: RloB domain-containing protein [Pirellulales bacterium]|nr:RloB domain-containing protein [Pirellulales bacterium]
MNLRRKKPRPLVREDGDYRDARLFVIATEDTYAPSQYFRLFRNPRIKMRILPTEGGLSSPKHVLDRLDEFIKEYETDDGDELWLLLDTDHWTERNHIDDFCEVCQEAKQKHFQLAHSNPCFETWLLLHLEDLDPSKQFARCQDVVKRLREILGGYNKCRIDGSHFSLDRVALAVQRAERLDESPKEAWPRKTGSHVYRLVKALLPK